MAAAEEAPDAVAAVVQTSLLPSPAEPASARSRPAAAANRRATSSVGETRPLRYRETELGWRTPPRPGENTFSATFARPRPSRSRRRLSARSTRTFGSSGNLDLTPGRTRRVRGFSASSWDLRVKRNLLAQQLHDERVKDPRQPSSLTKRKPKGEREKLCLQPLAGERAPAYSPTHRAASRVPHSLFGVNENLHPSECKITY